MFWLGPPTPKVLGSYTPKDKCPIMNHGWNRDRWFMIGRLSWAYVIAKHISNPDLVPFLKNMRAMVSFVLGRTAAAGTAGQATPCS